MHGRGLRGALWRHRLLALLILAIAVLLGVVALQQAAKTYDASTDVAADLATPTSDGPTSDGPTSDAGGAVGLEGSNQPVGSVDVGASGGSAQAALLRADLVAATGSVAVADDVRQRLSVPRSTAELRRSISGTFVSGTTVLHITAADREPAVAAEIANTAVAVLPLQDAGRAFVFTTTRPARTPTRWSSPDPLLSFGGVALGAILLAVAGALWRERRDRPVHDGAGVEGATSAPLLAHLAAPDDPADLPALDPGSSAGEVFRSLREALEDGSARASMSRIVVAGVTGGDRGDGRSDGRGDGRGGSGDAAIWLGANLAISLADAGRRVLLVDGRLGERFGARSPDEPATAGLYDVLCGAPLDHGLSPGPTPGLMVLPSGAWGAQGPEALIERRFAEVMAAASERFDVVVVLAPPLEVSDDARSMAAGGSLVLAVGEGEVSAGDLRAHADRVRAVGVRLLGTVLVGRAGAAARVPSS